MNDKTKAGVKTPASVEGATILDEKTLRRMAPLIGARFEFYRQKYEETSNPLLVWRVIWEYSTLGKRLGLPVSFPDWCAAYLLQAALALDQLAAPAALDDSAPAVAPQKARSAVADALGLVSRGRSHFHASARAMIDHDIGLRARRLREQGFTETQAVEALSILYEKDERTIRGHIARFRKEYRLKEKLLRAARGQQDKT